MNRLIPLYEQEPGKLAALHDKLSEVHAGLSRPDGDEAPAEHTAHFNDDWDIVLEGAPGGELIGASAIRRGTEQYVFERTGDAAWSASDSITRFPEPHFHSLVTMATQQGLEWTESPAAN